MSIIEQATLNMERLASDNSHGYDQANRWGPDYDCSSAVISSWQNAGVPVKTNGASYTGNMRGAFLASGFSDVTGSVNLATGAGLQRGDVLLNQRSHTAMYVGNGTIAHASLNENGGTTGGRTGDQTGREICLRSYYNFPWDCVLRYTKASSVPSTQEPVAEPVEPEKPSYSYHSYTYNVAVSLLKMGDYGPQVKHMQQLLTALGFRCDDDGQFGYETFSKLKEFQRAARIDVDGEWGGQSFKAAWNYEG